MRIFALVIALFCFGVSEADAQRRGPVRRAGVRAVRAVRRFIAPIRAVRAPIVIGRQAIRVAPIVVQRVSAFRHAEQIVVRRIIAAHKIVIPTYQSYVAPQTIVSQEVATDACGIQQIAVAREVTGYSGGCGSLAIRVR
jgi:hypothetical protein